MKPVHAVALFVLACAVAWGYAKLPATQTAIAEIPMDLSTDMYEAVQLSGDESIILDKRSRKEVGRVPGSAIIDGEAVTVFAPTDFRNELQRGSFDPTTGVTTMELLPAVKAPQANEVDLREAQITSDTGFNPAKIADDNSRTGWGLGIRTLDPACRPDIRGSVHIQLARPVHASKLLVDYYVAQNVRLEVQVNGKEVALAPTISLNRKVSEVSFTLVKPEGFPPMLPAGSIREVALTK